MTKKLKKNCLLILNLIDNEHKYTTNKNGI